jgi:hypothetical protein
MAQDRKHVRDLRPWYVRVREAAGAKERGMRNGYRSGLEEQNAKFLAANGVPVLYETLKINYVIPESKHTYTPDFPLYDVMYIETKGKLETSDRAKHILIKAQRPEYDIRFVFARATDPIYKSSPTSYAMWADKHGFKWANKLIPIQWIEEAKQKAAEKEKRA